MMKKKVAIFLFLLFVLMLPLIAYASSYVGNAHSHKFHYSDCRYVSQMNESNKVWFDSREEAIGSGYVPCKVCRP